VPARVDHDLRRLASELACAFAERRGLPELIAFVVATFREFLKAEGVAVVLLDRENDELYFPFSAEENPQVAEHLSRIRFPANRGIAGKVLRTGQSLRIDDVSADPWFFGGVDQQTQRTTRSLVCAPLLSAHGAIGVIEAVNPRGGGRFTDDDLVLLDGVATTIAGAIENARYQGAPPASQPRAPQHDGEVGHERPAVRDYVFAREGEYWTITYEGRTARLRHTKGLAYIAHLLRHPGQELHAIDLINIVAGGAVEARRGQPEAGSRRRDLGDAGEMLDREAKAAYKHRLAELQEELREAEEFNDPGRMEKVQHEIESLAQELSRAVGLGGRARRAGAHAERARVSVTRAIASALEKIGEHNARLGRHLGATIKTGVFCSYVPDPRAPLAWVV